MSKINAIRKAIETFCFRQPSWKSKINAIRKAIETLSEDEYVELRQWFSERDWKKWDREIEKDSKAGKLDFLVREAFDQKHQGKLKDL